MNQSGLLTCKGYSLRTASSAIGIREMDRGVAEPETPQALQRSSRLRNHQERLPGTLKKYRVIAKVSEFGSKCTGWMITRFRFKKGRAAANTTTGKTEVFWGRNEVGNYAT